MAAQSDDTDLASEFAPVAEALAHAEEAILAELAANGGSAADTGGYYLNDDAKAAGIMRPSGTLNEIIG